MTRIPYVGEFLRGKELDGGLSAFTLYRDLHFRKKISVVDGVLYQGEHAVVIKVDEVERVVQLLTSSGKMGWIWWGNLGIIK